jgi:hypothetical protein
MGNPQSVPSPRDVAKAPPSPVAGGEQANFFTPLIIAVGVRRIAAAFGIWM